MNSQSQSQSQSPVGDASTTRPSLFPMERHAGYEELWSSTGQPRTHQERLLRFLEAATPEELNRLRRTVLHRINEQEVTFNILGVPEGTNRAWTLDPVPHVVDPQEWATLGARLRQRAQLLSLVVADLFGDQRLLKERVIPPELLFSHPAYLRPCQGYEPIGGLRLHLYAADVARGVDGNQVVFSDRTAAPAGAGYALENRLVLGSALPDLFNGYGVERVRSYFESVRRCVGEVCPAGSSEPLIVVLSPGTHDQSSFEHAYLARYLGYELVEGRDLTVRDRVVYLKTLSGLRRVDVILRRIPDVACDPLWLRDDAPGGAPGLVAAAAAGNVALVNPLGVGVCESPAFKAYLPAAAKMLLGEELQLPSVETYWCGDEVPFKQHVLPQFEQLVFKPAFEDRSGDPLIPARMSASAKSEFFERLRTRPSRYVAERWPELSVAPFFDGERLENGSLTIRNFLCREGDDYCVMPGGLARVDAAPDGLFLSIRGDYASKDVWLPTQKEAPGRSPPRMPDGRVELRRGGIDLPSRLLDDLFWLGRYVERCDMSARLLRAGFDRLGFEADRDAPEALSGILQTMNALELTHGVVERPDRAAAEALLRGALWDEGNPSSLRAMCQRVRSLTLSARSRLSRDAQHVLRELGTAVPSEERLSQNEAVELLDEVLITLSAVTGTMLDNMVRGHTWLFLDMGRRLERGSLTLGLVRAMLPPGASRAHMEALLEIADSLLTYRARYLSSLQVAPVVDLLITDDTNPRSLSFQVAALLDHVQRLPQSGEVLRGRAERRIIELQSSLLTADIVRACAGDGSGLRQMLEDGSHLLWQISDHITHTWVSHATPTHTVSVPLWIDEELEAL